MTPIPQPRAALDSPAPPVAPAPRRRGPSQAAMQAATALGFVAIGAVMVVSNLEIGVQWASDGPQAGYFPFRIGLLLVVCGAAALRSALRERGAGAALPFVEPERFRSVLAVAAPTGLYVLGIQWLGLYVASAAFLAYFMR